MRHAIRLLIVALLVGGLSGAFARNYSVEVNGETESRDCDAPENLAEAAAEERCVWDWLNDEWPDHVTYDDVNWDIMQSRDSFSVYGNSYDGGYSPDLRRMQD